MTAARHPTETERQAGEVVGFGAPLALADRPRLRLLRWKPVIKVSLRGFADVRLPSGLIVRECPVHLSGGRRWATLPAKSQIDRDGQLRHDGRGKIAYTALFEWATSDLRDGFSARVVEIVLEQHPDAFAGDPVR